MTVGTYGRSLVSVELTAVRGRRTLVRGVVRGAPQGRVHVPLRQAPAGTGIPARLCVRNTGPSLIVIGGTADGSVVRRAGVRATGPFAALYVDAHATDWLSHAGAIAANGRLAPLAGATLWASVALALVAGGAAAVVVLRAGRR